MNRLRLNFNTTVLRLTRPYSYYMIAYNVVMKVFYYTSLPEFLVLNQFCPSVTSNTAVWYFLK